MYTGVDGSSKANTRNQKLPYDVAMLEWARQNYRMVGSNKSDEGGNSDRPAYGVFLDSPGSDIKQMRQIDVPVKMGDGEMRLPIFIYRYQVGSIETGLIRNTCRAISKYAIWNRRSPISPFTRGFGSRELPHSVWIEKKLRTITIRSVSVKDLDAKRFVANSSRSGWATVLYVRGAILWHIRRLGRWASGNFRRYLYRNNQISELPNPP